LAAHGIVVLLYGFPAPWIPYFGVFISFISIGVGAGHDESTRRYGIFQFRETGSQVRVVIMSVQAAIAERTTKRF
jgi:hypothetical protein